MDIRGEICKIISRMLDNPDDCGIFPTTECYDDLEKLVFRKQFEAMGWTYAHACILQDRGIDIRTVLVPDIIKQANKDLEMKNGN